MKDKIIEKQDEYIRYLKRAIHSESILSNITAGVQDKFDAELAELKSQDKEVKDEDNSDPMCFHECPMCQTRCNCDTVYCTHCEEEVTDVDIEKYIDTFLNHEVFDIELIGDDMQDNNNLKRTLRHGIRQGARAIRDGKIKPNK